jgi:hypothetical protein
VPSEKGFLSVIRTRPSGPRVTRSCASTCLNARTLFHECTVHCDSPRKRDWSKLSGASPALAERRQRHTLCFRAAMLPTRWIRVRRRFAVFCLLLATWVTPAFAQPTQAAQEVHALQWKRLGEWKGYSLNGHEINALYISDSIRWLGEEGFGQILEMDVAGPTRTWAVRCSFKYGVRFQYDAVCDFVPSDGTSASTLVLGSDTKGYLLGEAELDVSWNFFNGEALQLFFGRPNGSQVASWSYEFRIGNPLQLTLHAPNPEERELASLAVLAMLPLDDAATTPNLVAPKASNRLDSYPLIAGAPREDRGQRAALARLDERGATRASALLRRHLGDSRRIDRSSEPYVKRHPWSLRPAFGLHGGVTFAPDPDGAPRGIGGGNVEMLAGVRLNYLMFGVSMGLHPGELDAGRFRSIVEGRGVGSAGFSLGLQARAARPIVGDLEGVIGLAVAARLRLVDVAGWGEGAGASQIGGSLGPILGLQYPIWKMNDLGSRVLLTLEGRPEWQFWGKPGSTAPPDASVAAERLKQGLSGSDLAIRTSFGFRFEL